MQNLDYRLEQKPDLWVNVRTWVQHKIAMNKPANPHSHFHFHFHFHFHYRNNYRVRRDYTLDEIRVCQYTEGTLNNDVVDINNKKLLWQGIAIGKLTKITRGKIETKINDAVHLPFQKYPIVNYT